MLLLLLMMMMMMMMIIIIVTLSKAQTPLVSICCGLLWICTTNRNK